MLYLFAAICASSSIALLFKYSEKHGANRYVVTTLNYAAATVTAAVLAWWGGLPETAPAHPGAALSALGPVLAGDTAAAADPSVALSLALGLGLPAGVLFFAAFITYQLAVRHAGVSAAGAFSKAAVLIPMAMALLLWHEWPSRLQWVGVCLAVAAGALAAWPRKGVPRRRLIWLLGVFVCMGGAEFSKKLFQKLGDPGHKPLFLLATFGVALLLSLIPTVATRRAPKPRDIGLGAVVGICNLAAASFLISALDRYPAAVAFPVFSAGCIVLICLGAHVLYREEVSGRERLAIALILPAVVLMNLGPG